MKKKADKPKKNILIYQHYVFYFLSFIHSILYMKRVFSLRVLSILTK